MSIIYLNQKVTLNATDLQGRDMDLVTFRIDYWAPSNQTDTPTGTLDPGAWVTTPGSPIVVVTVPKDLLDEPSESNRLWRFQIIDTTSGIPWTPTCFAVKNRGAS